MKRHRRRLIQTPYNFVRTRFGEFAAQSVLWRHCLDFAVTNIPFYLQPILLFFTTVFFFVLAAAQRRALVANLGVVFPNASRVTKHLRAFWSLWNYSWTITEAATHKLCKPDFRFEIEGAEYLEQLAQAKGAIVLTAHMGNYDLGAALFAQKCHREMRMVRAPEPDARTAQHLAASVEQTSAGAVKIDYNSKGSLLSFDLLNAVRAGEIVSIQGDRVIPGVASAEGTVFERTLLVPGGPFTLALVAGVPIFPLFIVRAGFRRYRIIVREPIVLARTGGARQDDIARGVALWCAVLEETVARFWDQWSAFEPVFTANADG